MPSSTGCHLLSIAGMIKAHQLTRDGEPMDLEPDDDAPLAALAFKIMTDPYVGRLTFVRIYSGTLDKGMNLDQHDKRHKRKNLPPARNAR